MSTQEKLRNGEDLNVGQDHYDKEFNRLTSSPDMQALEDQGDSYARDSNPSKNADASRDAVNNAEKTAIGDTAAGKAATATATAVGTPAAGAAAKILGKIKVNRTSGGIMIAGILAAGLIVIISIFAGSLGPIAFFSNIIDDLNDNLPAMDKRMSKLMKNKALTNEERAELLKGCKKLSVRCKFKSLSNSDIKRFKRAGIIVEGETISIGDKTVRTFPKSYKMTIDGEERTFTSAQLADALTSKNESHRIIKARVRTALNMRSFAFMDKIHSVVMRMIGASKIAPKITGDVEEDTKIIARGKGNISADSTVVISSDKDGKTTVNGQEATPGTANATEVLAEGAANGFKNGASQFLKVLNITGAVDMACSLKNMIGYTVTAAKYAKGIKLAQYVMPLAAMAYKVKAGDATPKEGEVIGKIFTDPDTRKTITDVKSSLETASGSSITEKTQPNPYYGKNALDSSLSKMSAIKAPPITNEVTQKYSLGISLLSLLGILSFGVQLMDTIGIVNDPTCKLVQNWFVRGGSLVVGILAWFVGIGEANTANNIAIAVMISAAFIAVSIALSVITNQDPVPEDINQKPEELAAAAWTGESFIASKNAQTRGLIPGTNEQILAYSKDRAEMRLAYDQIESKNTSWHDTSSPHSALSKIALRLAPSVPTDGSAVSYIGSVGSLLGTAATTMIDNQPAYAATIDQARLKKCQADPQFDSQMKAAPGDQPIALDVQCNVRYYMPAADLEMDTDEVAKYMENQGFVEKDTETGLPEGYTLPEENASQNMAIAFLTGTLKGVVDQFYSTRNYVNDYGKYLDFCAYRALPWGKTYEESSGIGSAEEDWINGKNCMKDDYQTRAFRIYTLDKVVNDASEPGEEDGATIVGSAPSSGQPSGGTTGGGLASGSAKELAQQIISSGKVTGDSRYINQIKAYANGDTSCHLNPTILSLIATIMQKHTIYISSINRYCTGTLTASGTASYHYTQQGGHAVDIATVDGVASSGATQKDITLLNEIMPSLPSGSGIGQSNCRSTPLTLGSGVREFFDSCNHIHIQVPIQ